MMRNKIVALLCVFMLYSFSVYAAESSIDVGIAKGDKSSTVYSLGHTNMYKPWFRSGSFVVSPTFGLKAHLIDPKHGSDVFAFGISGGLRLDFSPSRSKTYMAFSVAPSYLSKSHIGSRDMGGHFQFASTAALGFHFGGASKHSLEAFITHFSHAGINGSHNPGFNFYGLNYRFAF